VDLPDKYLKERRDSEKKERQSRGKDDDIGRILFFQVEDGKKEGKGREGIAHHPEDLNEHVREIGPCFAAKVTDRPVGYGMK
jgi:hypothetical protein